MGGARLFDLLNLLKLLRNFGFIEIIELIEIIEIIEFIENFVTPIERRWRDQATKREVYSKLTLQPVRAVSNE